MGSVGSFAELDIGPLGWVKDEIELALAKASELLQSYAGQRQQQQLIEARAYLHQAHGALSVVGLDGVTEFSRAIERLLDGVLADEFPWSSAVADAAQHGMHSLREYLVELMAGRPNQPLRLLPVYRQVCLARGATEVVTSDLFFPDLTQRPPRRQQKFVALEDSAVQARFKAARLGFERGLSKWLRDDQNGVRDMRNSIAIIESLQTQPSTRSFWWVTLAYFEALAGGGIDDDVHNRQLCTRIDAQVRKLLDGAEAVAERLMRDVLYGVAQSSFSSEHIEMVAAVYRLRELLPSAALNEKREAILKEMRERIGIASMTWESFCSGAAIALPRFHDQSAQLLSLAEKTGHVDFARLVAVLGNWSNLLRKNPLLHSDQIATEVATILLLTDNAINQFDKLSGDFSAQVDAISVRFNAAQRGESLSSQTLASLAELAQQAANQLLLHEGVRDLRSNLLVIERALDTFFRESMADGLFDKVAEPLRQVAHMFSRLKQERAVEVTNDCARSIAAFAAPDHQRQDGEFEDVAKRISALGFFVEQLQRGPADLDVILNPPAIATQVFAASVETEMTQTVLMARTLIGELRAASDDEALRKLLRTEIKQNLEKVRDDARLVANPDIERQAEAALHVLDTETTTEGIEAAVEAKLMPLVQYTMTAFQLSAEASRLAQVGPDEIDSELVAFFIEEVLQILDTVGVQLYRAIANPQNNEHMLVLRRCFHTLKGSSRMVGLIEFSATAQAVEAVLNRHLLQERPASAELHAMVDTAQKIVSDWIDRLQRHASPPNPAPLLRQCELLLAQITASDARMPIIPTIAESLANKESGTAEEAKISLGSLTIATRFYDSYLNEAREHLALLEKDWHRLPGATLIRAAHTLGGISGTLGLKPVKLLAQALESALERFASAGVATDSATDTSLQLSLRRLKAMMASIADQEYPLADPELVARLNSLKPAQGKGPAISAPPRLAIVSATGTLASTKTQVDVTVKTAVGFDGELQSLFLEESQDLVTVAASGFRAWRDGSDPGAEALQRVLHTLKGSARMAGMNDIGATVHNIETRIADYVASEKSTQAKPSALIDELEIEFDSAAAQIDQLRTVPEISVDAAQPVLRVRADLVDALVNESGEIAIARSRIEGEVKTLRASLDDLTENVTRLRGQLRELEIQAELRIQSRRAQIQEHDFDPLEMDRFTRLQELTRMMAESVNDVATVENNLMLDLDQIDVSLTLQARLSRELTQRLLSVRMVPFTSVFERLQRVVRQTSQELGKTVVLSIEGGDTELDRSVLERMTAPIEHLLRNAVVHGIEDPGARQAAGKSSQGAVTLILAQEGNEISITVRDDGAGLDYQKIRSQAIKRGLLLATQNIDEGRLAQFIYQPGFTTATHLSASAGRGVGMDVVRNETTALGGQIEVKAQAGMGTSFILQLPLTLAVVPAVMVKCGARRFAIPTAMVLQVSEIKQEAMVDLRTAGSVEWQGQRHALHYLPRLLGDINAMPRAQSRHWLILLKGGMQRVALEVDDLLGNEETVVKNVGPQLARVSGISGATVQSDGEIVLILNPAALVNRTIPALSTTSPASSLMTASPLPSGVFAGVRSTPPKSSPPHQLPSIVASPAIIMVVDDSLTVRKITSRLLDRAGYRVVTAKDGVDALEQLAGLIPDVILADIEMPRMDGFDLVRHIRADERLQHLPIIMITSRIADKHRNYAAELGVNHYLGKPYDEEALLRMIADYVKR